MNKKKIKGKWKEEMNSKAEWMRIKTEGEDEERRERERREREVDEEKGKK